MTAKKPREPHEQGGTSKPTACGRTLADDPVGL
jgi:hypothetical protein